MEGQTLEARLAADADQLDMILELRRLDRHGHAQAAEWLTYAAKRLKTPEGQRLCREILVSGPDDWWFEKNESLWVDPKGI